MLYKGSQDGNRTVRELFCYGEALFLCRKRGCKFGGMLLSGQRDA